MFTLSIAHGDYELSPGDVWRILSGSGSKIENRIVIDVRLGRALVGLLVGAALALAGALTQSVARNPLASPDVLGITQGASLAAVILLTFAHGGGSLGESADVILHTLRLPSAAVVGALIVATVVWLIAGSSRHSMVRFVLIGVAISTLCASLNTWIMSIGDLDQVASARLWLTGSLNGRDLDEVWAPLTVVLAAALASAYLSFHLAALTLGDTTATLLGHNVRVIQAVQLVFAVALSAIAVAAAGPIGFVAFVSPQVAMRLAGTPTPPLITSALTGALLVTSADFIARVVLPWELPVGIVTTIVGAPVLIYLIIKLNRKATR
ncbi:iron ABC transporter permease [uncultured Corynebacterium sp.]|uniref:FecCD family ABC transporter permease n=1 Tax=uncultured Corynebacterium sp. TaxID=159447 RepID=UPI0025D0645F|nr:iron ABC transporter permease [uncultured Corynebacterium sp.]